MKSIPLTKTKETVISGGADREVNFDTKELVKMVLNHPPEKGFDVSEMKSRLKVMDALERVNGAETLELEDAEYNVLAGCAKVMRWGVLSRSVVEFAAQFESSS